MLFVDEKAKAKILDEGVLNKLASHLRSDMHTRHRMNLLFLLQGHNDVYTHKLMTYTTTKTSDVITLVFLN